MLILKTWEVLRKFSILLPASDCPTTILMNKCISGTLSDWTLSTSRVKYMAQSNTPLEMKTSLSQCVQMGTIPNRAKQKSKLKIYITFPSCCALDPGDINKLTSIL